MFGLDSTNIRKMILLGANCTFAKAKEIALSLEASAKDVLQMTNGVTQSIESVNSVKNVY